jgi:ribosomal protein L11 methyltransferase
MPTFTALTTLTGQKGAEALGEAMERLTPEPTGIGVFEMEDGSGLWEVGGYFTDTPDAAALAVLAAAFEAKPFVVSELPETDWVAKVRRELSPVEAGRFFVYGSHDADKVPEGCEPLLIEAAMAFGTGHHGTTLGCLRALDTLANDGFIGKRVADIGCGTAVLAMGAARIWPDQVYASDIDQVAVDVAVANATANGLENRIHCVEAAGFDHPDLKAAAPFDLVFANILKGPLVALAPDMAANMQPGGYAILSGILNEQAGDVMAVYAQNGFNLVESQEIVEWTTLMVKKKP